MKKNLLFMLMALPFLFTSCSDDDDDFSSADIVGSWVLEKCTAADVKTSSTEATNAITKDIEGESDKTVYLFAEDGKFKQNGVFVGTYALNGDKLRMTIEGETDETKISISGNIMTMDVDETEYYQDEIEYLIKNAGDVKVTKVITRYHYKKV